MLSVVMLNVDMPNVVMLNVVMLNVLAPYYVVITKFVSQPKPTTIHLPIRRSMCLQGSDSPLI